MICQEGSGACQHPNIYTVAYIKLCIYRGGKQSQEMRDL